GELLRDALAFAPEADRSTDQIPGGRRYPLDPHRRRAPFGGPPQTPLPAPLAPAPAHGPGYDRAGRGTPARGASGERGGRAGAGGRGLKRSGVGGDDGAVPKKQGGGGPSHTPG